MLRYQLYQFNDFLLTHICGVPTSVIYGRRMRMLRIYNTWNKFQLARKLIYFAQLTSIKCQLKYSKNTQIATNKEPHSRIKV